MEPSILVNNQTRSEYKFERLWPVSAVFQALRQAGLVIEHFGEHADEYWNAFPNLKPEFKGQIPMTFSMMARRP